MLLFSCQYILEHFGNIEIPEKTKKKRTSNYET